MKKYKALCNVREFLNYPGFHGGATIQFYVEDMRERKARGEAPNLYINEPRVIFEVSDCSQSCRLEFNLYSDEQRANSLFKADMLLKGVQEFRDKLYQATEIYVEQSKAVKKKNKKAKKKGKKSDPMAVGL